MIQTIQLMFLILFAVSCSNASKGDKKEQTIDYLVVINKDSCLKWKLPVTSFKLACPLNYKPRFHPKEMSYLTLTRIGDSGIVLQEFDFGKCQNIKTEKDVQQATIEADSMLNQLKVYKRNTIGYKTIAGKKLYVATGTINFDPFGTNKYKGDYNVFITFLPSDKQQNGVSVSAVSKAIYDSASQNRDLNDILKTLEFSKE